MWIFLTYFRANIFKGLFRFEVQPAVKRTENSSPNGNWLDEEDLLGTIFVFPLKIVSLVGDI